MDFLLGTIPSTAHRDLKFQGRVEALLDHEGRGAMLIMLPLDDLIVHG